MKKPRHSPKQRGRTDTSKGISIKTLTLADLKRIKHLLTHRQLISILNSVEA